MLAALKIILQVQELDIKMIQLMRVKRERQKELRQIHSLRVELAAQIDRKTGEVASFNSEIQDLETKLTEIGEKIKALDARQSSVKKVDEFNALTQEMTVAEREKVAIENQIFDLTDKRISEETVVEKLKESLQTTEESSKALEIDIQGTIEKINEEGHKLKTERDEIAAKADPATLAIYERLINNKKDRVVVPLVNRTCTGCHITLTPQHENLVRKGENLIFCEHCSRIHFWQESQTDEAGEAPRRRRRRAATV